MSFRLLYGGRIIENWAVKSGDYTANYVWTAGNILTLSGGYAMLAPADSTGPFGISQESRQEPVGDDITPDECYTSGYVSVITGEAIGITDDYVSGVTFAENDKLYNCSGGNFSNVQNSSEPAVGRVREVMSDDSLKIFWRPSDI
jgi:hypothetical protein